MLQTLLRGRALLTEELGRQELAAIALSSISIEKGRRKALYNVLKWWGRRYSALARALLASLVLKPSEKDVLLAILMNKNNALELVAKRARGKLIVDPFVGGATILVEAMLLGFDAYGVDVNPAAVDVAKSTIGIIEGSTCNQLKCLEDALAVTAEKLAYLWSSPCGIIIHIMLAPVVEEHLEVPVWLATLSMKNRRIIILDPNSPSGLRELEGPETEKYRPTHPRVRIPARLLPEEAPGLRAYAVEVLRNDGSRQFIPLYTEKGYKLARWLEETRPELVTTCTPIPLLRETKRLHKKGLQCWEQLYTPRQLVSLRAFVKEAEARGCGKLARLITGNATRTASLLAMYYQPYSKVNPGLVIKSYWLPSYPVELNPLAYTYTKRGMLRSAGRGTLATYITALRRACNNTPELKPKAIVVRGDARSPHSIPENAYAVVTDPPYPGMQSYHDMSLIYLYWLGEPFRNNNNYPLTGNEYLKLIRSFSYAVAKRLQPTRVLLLLIGGETMTLAASLAEIAKMGFGLRRLYWLPGEAPGKLGRSRMRGIFIAVYRYLAPSNEDALKPLSWIDYIVASLEDEKENLSLNIEEEKEKAQTIAKILTKILLKRGNALEK